MTERLHGDEQTTVDRTHREDGGRQTTDEIGRGTWRGQEETREAKAEMGVRKAGRRGGTLLEEDNMVMCAFNIARNNKKPTFLMHSLIVHLATW